MNILYFLVHAIDGLGRGVFRSPEAQGICEIVWMEWAIDPW